MNGTVTDIAAMFACPACADLYLTQREAEDVLIEHLMACDDSTLHTWKDGEGNSHVYFVLGNEPFEVACDYGVSLEPCHRSAHRVVGGLTTSSG